MVFKLHGKEKHLMKKQIQEGGGGKKEGYTRWN